MLFSIIIPVYNAAPYLSKCVDSAIAQTVSDYEVILIDDGSTDQSLRLCAAYAEAYPFVHVYHQSNQGHTAARNAGLNAAKGDYILFADSDDWLEASLLEDCRTCILRYAPELVLFGFRKVGECAAEEKPQPQPPGYYDRPRLEREILPTLLTDGRFSLCERVFKRELLIEYQTRADPRLLLGEDFICCVCAAANASSAYILEGVYYNYYQHGGSVSHTYRNYYFEDWFLLRAVLVRELSNKLPDFETQLGCCSIRFLHRAVLGELARNGASLRTRNAAAVRLKRPDVRSDLRAARAFPLKRRQRVKVFCLEHRLVYLLAMADKASHLLRRGWQAMKAQGQAGDSY